MINIKKLMFLTLLFSILISKNIFADNKQYSITPEGNLTLIDDIEEIETTNREFITLQSKNGNYFYIVIDRTTDKDNVYFLNLVDEGDLLSLIDDKSIIEEYNKKCSCQEKCTDKNKDKNCSVCIDDINKCEGLEKIVEEQKPQEEPKNNKISPMPIIAFPIILLFIGIAIFYFKFIKYKTPKDNRKSTLEEYDFDEDDEEYDMYKDNEDDEENS